PGARRRRRRLVAAIGANRITPLTQPSPPANHGGEGSKGGILAKGYFVSTVGINEKIIRRYVQKQGEEDAGQAQLEL
ncbi:MAG: hypothetical protein ACE5JZ_05335, partial [Kiloniellales bacterium]